MILCIKTTKKDEIIQSFVCNSFWTIFSGLFITFPESAHLIIFSLNMFALMISCIHNEVKRMNVRILLHATGDLLGVPHLHPTAGLALETLWSQKGFSRFWRWVDWWWLRTGTWFVKQKVSEETLYVTIVVYFLL